MLRRHRGDISGAAAVMKGCWTMTRPSQLLSEPPPPKPPIPPTSTLLDPLLYLGGTLENLIVTEHLTKTKVSGWQLEMTGLAASVQSIPHTASFTHVLLFLFLFFPPWERPAMWAKHRQNILTSPRISRCTDGSSGHQHTDTIITQKFVSLTLSFCFPGNHVYAHSTSPLTVRRLLPPRCQHSTG